MSEHQKHTEFLRRIIVYADTEAHRELDRRIAQLQREEHCLRRAALGAVFFTLMVFAGLGYVAILDENFPYNPSKILVTALCDAGLASLVCLAGFSLLLVVNRKRLNQLRDECRQLVEKVVERELGKSRAAGLGDDRSDLGDRETSHLPTKVTSSPERLGSVGRRAMNDGGKQPNELSVA